MAFASRALIAALTLACGGHALATGGFYEEPLPTLSELLRAEQLPARSLADIWQKEGASPAPAKVDFKTEILALAKLPAERGLAAVEKLLPQARVTQIATGSGVINLLHDLRDLFVFGKATATERASYIEWRVENADRIGLSWKPENERPLALAGGDELSSLENLAAEAAPALRPHWLYLRGAASFKSGDDTDSAIWFQRVRDEYPAHPRAEAAQFMVARCLLSQSRKLSDQPETPGLVYISNAAVREKARRAFEDYLAKYPRGRFAGDTLGWLGAAAYDAGDNIHALQFYVQQAELPDHPELAASAAIMGEKVLSRIASAADDAQFAELAKTPSAALGLIYLILNTTESDNFDGGADDPAQVREWRREILPRLASAIVANETLYRDAKWRPRYLAMLVLASSGAGNQEEALRLSELAGAAPTEDLLFARGIAFQRAKRPKEAAAAFAELLERFPNSALATEVIFRQAFALFDDGRAGEALVSLLKNEPPETWEVESASAPILSKMEPRQFTQLIDAMENFAPIAELISAANAPVLDGPTRWKLGEAACQRLVAKEQFAEALRDLPDHERPGAARIAKLTEIVNTARNPTEKAAACLLLGDAWAAARGKLLTVPLDTEEHRSKVFRTHHPDANVRRLENAQTLSIGRNAALELANRDELRHAFNWWLAASDAQPKAPVAAQALWRALRAMPLIADVSPFHYARAVEQNWSEVSRTLYERLKKDHPASEEARRFAVYWNFAAAPKAEGEEEYWGEVGAGWDSPRGPARKASEARESDIPEAPDGEANDTDAGLVHEILALEQLVQTADLATLKTTATSLQQRAHRGLRAANSSPVVNYIDDLATFFGEPDPGAAARLEYVRLRSAAERLAVGGVSQDHTPEIGSDDALRVEIATALADPKLARIADYLAFLDCAVVANHILDMPFAGVSKDGQPYTYRSRNYAELEKLTRAFLENHPRSRKREAALLLHAKALHRAMTPHVFLQESPWPAAARWEGGPNPVSLEQIPFDRATLARALDRSDKEFPQGRYAKEIRDFRAALAARTGDWKTALQLTVAQLDDHEKPSLHSPAWKRLEEIFNHLPNDAIRPDLLAAIKANPGARKRLGERIEAGGGSAKFTYMTAWLREQLTLR